MSVRRAEIASSLRRTGCLARRTSRDRCRGIGRRHACEVDVARAIHAAAGCPSHAASALSAAPRSQAAPTTRCEMRGSRRARPSSAACAGTSISIVATSPPRSGLNTAVALRGMRSAMSAADTSPNTAVARREPQRPTPSDGRSSASATRSAGSAGRLHFDARHARAGRGRLPRRDRAARRRAKRPGTSRAMPMASRPPLASRAAASSSREVGALHRCGARPRQRGRRESIAWCGGTRIAARAAGLAPSSSVRGQAALGGAQARRP